MLDKQFHNLILKFTGASSLEEIETIQELWSGYGQILRYSLEGSDRQSVVVKHINFPDKLKHPRGWNTKISHKRKLKSYKVEMAWYNRWAGMCNDKCYVPECLGIEKRGDEVLIVLEDLDLSGYSDRRSSVSWAEILVCLKWLANFHAAFMGHEPDELWKVGTYWHLDTRPDELKALEDSELKSVAGIIDQKLKSVKYKSFVHGDAKLANFCFSENGLRVSAVDFQYVGGGCGMKDIAYFVGSCLNEEESESMETDILDCYFSELKSALIENKKTLDPDEVEKEWRSMYYFAWADFHRFLKGWSPGHWKINSYSEKVVREILKKIEKSKAKKISNK